MPLLRNNRYSVTITGVSSHGLPSPHDALESVPANIEANVIDWVGGDGITTVVSNGVYMLGLSHDAFLFPRQQQTVASRFNELKVVTDYAGGWNAQVFDDEGCTVATPTGSGWLTLSTASNPAADYPDGTTTRLLTDEMTPDGGESRSAWIRIAAGDLRYKIGVTQTLFEPYIRITRTGGDEELSALEFSSHEPAPQSFTVRWSPANTPLDMTRVRNGNDHFTWQNASNELKELPAGGEYTFTIDPATHQLVYRTRGSYLIFTLSDPSGRTAASAIALTQRSVFEDAPSPALDNIASPVALPHTGGEGGVPVRSTVSVTLADSGTTVTEAVPWTAQFSTDNGANWSDTPPAWLSGFPTQGEGNVDGESLTYAVSEATVPANALDARPSRGTAATPWNLANSTGAVSPDQNTANCYIISAPGWYSLPLVYGNAVRNGSGASATYTSPLSGDNNPNILQHFLRHDGNPINASYIYSNTGFTAQTSIADAVPVWMDAPGLVSGVTLDNGRQHLEFEVPAATITPGNAVVAVRDANGHVMWSWHIWVTDAEPTQTVDVTNYQGKTYSFMRQNLGTVGDGTPFIPSRSVVVRITQQIAGGLSRQFIIQSNCRDSYFNSTFYQFGRKDPIPGLKDGYTYYEGTMGVSTEPGNIRLGVRHPNIFFVGNATSQYDWNYNTLTTEGTSNPYKQGVDNLWDIDNNARTHNDNTVHKTVYDPSPVGFKVPPGGAFSGFTTTGNNSQTQSEWRVVDNSGEAFASDGGWKFLTDDTGGNHLFFPATGYLAYNTGKVGGASNGYCWSAGPINNGYGYYFQFNAGVVNPFGNGGRSTGVPIRPIRE
jgi:hypothetical protein